LDRSFIEMIDPTNEFSDVPQNSILASTLFNIFINDIPKTRNVHLAVYADTIIYTVSS